MSKCFFNKSHLLSRPEKKWLVEIEKATRTLQMMVDRDLGKEKIKEEGRKERRKEESVDMAKSLGPEIVE